MDLGFYINPLFSVGYHATCLCAKINIGVFTVQHLVGIFGIFNWRYRFGHGFTNWDVFEILLSFTLGFWRGKNGVLRQFYHAPENSFWVYFGLSFQGGRCNVYELPANPSSLNYHLLHIIQALDSNFHWLLKGSFCKLNLLLFVSPKRTQPFNMATADDIWGKQNFLKNPTEANN